MLSVIETGRRALCKTTWLGDDRPAASDQPCPRHDLISCRIAACVASAWNEGELLATFRKAWPYRDLEAGELDQVLKPGCRVWRATGPFDHSKLMAVDGAWALIGSSNLDSRSLRLNFELDVEIYDRAVAGEVDAAIRHRIAGVRT